MNSVPDIYSFQYDRASNGHLESNVNMYRGAVCFYYSLIDLPKQENVGISVSASYNSDIDKSVTVRNLEAPTGILGLGWRLTYEKIECDREGAGKLPAYRSYRITTGDCPGGGTPLHLLEEKGGLLYFEKETYDGSKIIYNPHEEVWCITDVHGVKRRYGGKDGLQYTVLSSGRYTQAACTDPDALSRAVKSWNLYEIISPGGFTVCYSYDFTEQQVVQNGPCYTKASYIKEITDAFGNAAKFTYKEKLWSENIREDREYADPHKEIPDLSPDFYQSEYETKYLSEISVSCQDMYLYSVEFGYKMENYASDIPSAGDTAKRMLSSIQMVTKDGMMPAVQFTYFGPKDTNTGALKEVLYAEGGRVSYSYGQTQELTALERTCIVSNKEFLDPPRVFFGGDYALIIQNNYGKLQFTIYEWIGRWQKYTPGTLLDGIDPDTLEVSACSLYCIAACQSPDKGESKYVIFTKQRKVKGGWHTADVQAIRTSTLKMACSDTWFFLYDADYDEVIPYTYDERNEKWESGQFPESAGTDGQVRFFSVSGDRLLIFNYDQEGAGTNNTIQIYRYSQLDGWEELAKADACGIMLQDADSDRSCFLSFDGWIAAGAFISSLSGDSLRYTFCIFRYDADTENFSCELYEEKQLPLGDPSYTQPVIKGNTILSAGSLYRYCGNGWVTDESLAARLSGSYQFALSEDLALESYYHNGTVQVKGAVFDKNTREWDSCTLYNGQAQEASSYGVSACGGIAVIGKSVYDISLLDFDHMLEELDGSFYTTNLFNNGTCIAGSSYSEAESGDSQAEYSFIHNFQNGKLSRQDEDSCTFDYNCGGSGDIFSLNYENTDIKLLFAGCGSPVEPVTFYQAVGVRMDDGIDSITRTYRYDTSSAACDESGQYARYGKVEVLSGDGYESRTVYCYLDSVSEVSSLDNATRSSTKDGTLLSVYSYMDGRLDTKFKAEYQFTDTVDGKKCYGDVLAGGSQVQVSEIDENGEGISKITEFTADPKSGEQKELISYNYNIKGEKETHKRTAKFSYESCKEMEEANRLCDISEEVLTINGEIVCRQQHAYSQTDGCYFEKSLTLADPDGVRDKTIYEVTGRGKYGNVTGRESTFPTYMMYDKSGCLKVAEFTNSGIGEAFAYSFEDYEEPMYSEAEGAKLTDSICMAGTKCLEVKAGMSSSAITHTFIATGTDYGVSFYAECARGCLMRVSCNGKSLEQEVCAGTFQYQLADLRPLGIEQGKEQELEILFENQSGSPMYIDILSFFPLLNPPRIHIYQKNGALLAASLSSYGSISELIYDGLGRVVCTIENRSKVYAKIPSFLRETGKKANAELTLKNAGDGKYYKRIGAGESFGANLSLSERYFVLFSSTGDLDIRIGTGIQAARKGDLWTFDDALNGVHESAAKNGGIVSVFYSEIVMLAVNGEVLFSYRQEQGNGTSFSVKSTEEILDFAAGNDPCAEIEFSDGAGKPRQEHTFSDGKLCVTARAYDSFGNETAVTIPTYVEDNYFTYIGDYIKSIDAGTGELSGMASDLNPDCGGYPYSSRIYEQRPEGRVTEEGTPCPDYAVNPQTDRKLRHTVRTSYTKDTSSVDILHALPQYYKIVEICDPDNNMSYSVYDMLKNKIASVATASGVQMAVQYLTEYKDGKRTVSATMPNGNTRYTKYDFEGNMVYTSDVNAGEKKFFYGKNQNLRFARDAALDDMGMCRYRSYDSLFRLVEEGLCPLLEDSELAQKALGDDYPSDGKIINRRYIYDGNYSADEIGELTKIEIYDETSQNTLVSTISIAPDKKKRTVVKTLESGDAAYTHSIQFDQFGNIVSETGTDGIDTEYAYDTASRVVSVKRNGNTVTQTQYRADGSPLKAVLCGSTVQYEYDARGKITGIDSPFYREQVTYLENGSYYNGKIKSVETEIKTGAGGSTPSKIKYSLRYDESGRLVSADCTDHPEYALTDIQYDTNGNILSCNAGGTERTFSLQENTDQLKETDSAAYKYDKNGAAIKITKDNGSEVGIEYYRCSGLPKQVTACGVTSRFIYDENNRRIRKDSYKDGELVESGVYFYHDSRLSEEIRDSTPIKYIYGESGLAAVSKGGTDYSVITDRLGYTRAVAECRKIIQAYHYKPFGEAIKVIQDSDLVRLLFGNYEFDSLAGLYHAGARYYDPSSYRFLSTDLEGEFTSPYIFCGNDPFSMHDETGQSSWFAALIGAVVGVVLTVGLTVLTMGAGAPVACAVFGAGGTTITAATTAAKTAAIVAYQTAMSFSIAAASGFASEGVKCLIDGEPFTAASAYNILLSSAASSLVFGGAGTLLSSVGKFAVAPGDAGMVLAKKYMSQGAILSLINSGVSASESPLGDMINKDPISGKGVLENAGFGALSGALNVLVSAGAESNVLDIKKDIVKDTVYGTISSVSDPGMYYQIAVEAADSGSSDGIYDGYSVGAKAYVRKNGSADAALLKTSQVVHAYACFGNSNSTGSHAAFTDNRYPCLNIISPRYFSTRGFGQKLI